MVRGATYCERRIVRKCGVQRISNGEINGDLVKIVFKDDKPDAIEG